MPTWYFMVLERANRYYTLLMGELEVIMAKGNLIIPSRSSKTRCSFMSYPGHELLLLSLTSSVVEQSIKTLIVHNLNDLLYFGI